VKSSNFTWLVGPRFALQSSGWGGARAPESPKSSLVQSSSLGEMVMVLYARERFCGGW
jgi:hypothetical protein